MGRRLFLVLVFGLGLQRQAEARLWETQQQLQTRYGPPINKVENSPDGGKFYTYRFKEYRILVSIIGGKSLNEFYIREDGRPLSHDQVRHFLHENSFGDHWGYIWKHWKLPCRVLGKWKALAYDYNQVPTTHSPGLEICTVGYARRVNLFSEDQIPKNMERPPANLQ